MIEELKYILLNLYNKNLNSHFSLFNISKDNIKAIYKNVIIEGYADKILVYYDNDNSIMGVFKYLKYLNKQNTFRCFTNVSLAVEYLHYIAKAIEDIRFELFHYLLFKLDEINFEYNTLSYGFLRNFTIESFIVHCCFHKIKINNKKLNYSISVSFLYNGTCELCFYPEKSLWDEKKIHDENNIDKIIDYIKNIKIYKYEDVPLNEV